MHICPLIIQHLGAWPRFAKQVGFSPFPSTPTHVSFSSAIMGHHDPITQRLLLGSGGITSLDGLQPSCIGRASKSIALVVLTHQRIYHVSSHSPIIKLACLLKAKPSSTVEFTPWKSSLTAAVAFQAQPLPPFHQAKPYSLVGLSANGNVYEQKDGQLLPAPDSVPA
jgi:hypothetical protein